MSWRSVGIGTPVSGEKVSVTENEQFLELCPGGQFGPPVSDEELSVTENDQFLNQCPGGQFKH